jgi:hypothetical protein
MNGAQIVANNTIGSNTDNWHIVNTGDLNGDHRADIVWRADNGQVNLWQMNGDQILADSTIATLTHDWHLLG